MPSSSEIVEHIAELVLLDLFAALKLIVVDGYVMASQLDVEPSQGVPFCFPSVSGDTSVQGIACAKGFVHKVKVRPNVVPVQQKLRRLPFAVRDAVSEELKKLVQKDIIEEVDSSEWFPP
ncbi:UNVERIFIED_CONTAM: hypothetical protein K2H54_066228 [Gekko kuhli]